jgi:hypothetical protein
MDRERKGERREQRTQAGEKVPTSGAQLAEGGRKRGEGAQAGCSEGAGPRWPMRGKEGSEREPLGWRGEKKGMVGLRGKGKGRLLGSALFFFFSFFSSTLNHSNKPI